MEPHSIKPVGMYIKKIIEKLIAKGKIDRAFGKLMDYTSQKENEENRDLRDVIIHLSSSYSLLDNRLKKGIIDFQVYNTESKKIINTLIKVLEEIELIYDVFVSVPMKSFNENRELNFNSMLEVVKPLESIFKKEFKCDQIYCSMLEVKEEKKIESSHETLKKDLNRINKSKNFLLIYPEKLHSSCLVEAGYALALGIPSLYIVSDLTHLPYMLQDPKGLLPFNIHVEVLKGFNEYLPFISKNANKYLKI